MSSDNENQKSPNRLRSHSRSRSPIRLSPSHNNQQLSTPRDYHRSTSRNNNEHDFHDRKNNHYRSSYSNPNNTNDHRNTDCDQFNQTVNLYSDRELGLKYRWEKTVHVSNIPYDMKWTALKDLFRSEVGSVMYIEVFERDGKSLGCGSVEFRTVEEAKHAVEKMHQFEYDGRKLAVKLDEECYQTRQAKYQTVEGRLFQKNNMLHHHYTLSNQFGNTSENTNSISRSSQITDLDCIGTSHSNYSSIADIPSHVLKRLDSIEFTNMNMNTAKRKLNSNKRIKNFQCDQKRSSITTLDNVSNELFYEIFDYLDGYQIYESFSNLNYRFYQLLNSSCLLFKMIDYFTIKDDCFMNNWNEIISYNSKQIFSLTFYTSSRIKQFFSSSIIESSSLINLQALFLHNVQLDILMSDLIKLSSLPRLKSLTINMFDISIDLANIYQLVFKLSILTYYKLSIGATNLFISLPIATNQQQQSAIESLIIDHRCSFDELSAIISFTWQLRLLKLTHGFNDPLNKVLIPSIMLEYLTYLSLDIYGVEFDDFKTFIRKINSKLKTLNVIIQCEDMTYLDAYQWEQLLLHCYPQLEKFYFTYYDPKLVANDLNLLFVKILVEKTKRVLTITQIYHLIIIEKHASSCVLIQLIDLLPDLISLKIHSLSLEQTNDLDNIGLYSVHVRNQRQITAIYLEEINDIDDFYFILVVCPHMKYFKVERLNNMNIHFVLRRILKGIKNHHTDSIRSLCFNVPAADDRTIEDLQEMIIKEQLLIQFTIRRLVDSIYLQWT
ncbi:unnamed protein product [Rotaria sp. Silwood2]|nr:unnamed protein product [Rotaria sp. Silwood2]CAF4396271.1 unnamed protein product [Rotaria sp. Silwood2]